MTVVATSATQVALAVVVIVALGALATWLLQQRRGDVWCEFARRRGLKYVAPPDGPSVTGRIDGRSIEVVTRDSGSDQDVGGVAVVSMSLELHGVPHGMTADSVPGLIGDLAARAEDRIEFEQDDFDRDVLVKGDDEAAARDYWSRERQRAFLELVAESPSDQVAIRDAAIIAQIREVVSDLDQLERQLAVLRASARRLDDGAR